MGQLSSAMTTKMMESYSITAKKVSIFAINALLVIIAISFHILLRLKNLNRLFKRSNKIQISHISKKLLLKSTKFVHHRRLINYMYISFSINSVSSSPIYHMKKTMMSIHMRNLKTIN